MVGRTSSDNQVACGEKKYSVIELQLAVVVPAVDDKFHVYFGELQTFEVITDRSALQRLINLQKSCERPAIWGPRFRTETCKQRINGDGKTSKRTIYSAAPTIKIKTPQKFAICAAMLPATLSYVKKF